MNPYILFVIIACVLAGLGLLTYQLTNGLINVTELPTLDRMRYTAIQMTIMDLDTAEPLNITDQEIASQIFEYQQNNESIDRLTTFEIEGLYRNITNQSYS